MLGYRVIFEVPGRRDDVVAVVLGQLRSWLRSKGLDADALVEGERVALGSRSTGFLQRLRGGDQSESVRARIVEENATGRWTSTLTVHLPGDVHRAPWVWLDIDGPDGATAGVPRLARDLLRVLSSARSDVAHLRAEPEIVGLGAVDDLVEALLDDGRRRTIFVAGSDAQMPLPRWHELLSALLKQTVGLASAVVLDAEATEALWSRLGPTHGVAPGTLRTYLAHVVPGDALDARRHRILTTQRIVRDDSRVIARILGAAVRTTALNEPLPRSAIRIDRLLERQIDELLVAVQPAATPVALGVAAGAAAVHVVIPEVLTEADLLGAPEPDEVPPTPSHSAVASPWLAGWRRVGAEVLGIANVESIDVDRIIELAHLGLVAEVQSSKVTQRLAEMQDRLDSTRDELAALQCRLDDEQQDAAESAVELDVADRTVRHLRSLLATTSAAAEAWQAAPDEPDAPQSFEELLGRVGELQHVVVTLSRPELAVALDVRNPLGTWAEKTWNALLALEDYGASKKEGTCSKDVHGYLDGGAPSGRRTYSATRHARDESDSVKNDKQFRRPRVLPVPESVSTEREIFMGAHFKIAQSGLISPRVHYYDATGIDGKVYVGYIGPHLPTKHTS